MRIDQASYVRVGRECAYGDVTYRPQTGTECLKRLSANFDLTIHSVGSDWPRRRCNMMYLKCVSSSQHLWYFNIRVNGCLLQVNTGRHCHQDGACHAYSSITHEGMTAAVDGQVVTRGRTIAADCRNAPAISIALKCVFPHFLSLTSAREGGPPMAQSRSAANANHLTSRWRTSVFNYPHAGMEGPHDIFSLPWCYQDHALEREE